MVHPDYFISNNTKGPVFLHLWFCYDAAMKILLTFLTLVWAFSAPLMAQVSEPEQTPDVVEIPGPGETTVPAQALKLPSVPDSMDPREKALFQSAYDGDLAEVQILVSKGANVNFADIKKRTPLILAAHNGHISVVEFLYGKGADINAKDSDDQTALMYASKRSFNAIAEFLLNNGAEVNVKSRKKGNTALMLASGWGNVELVQLLLDKGANPAIQNNFGETAAVFAQKRGHSAIIDMLSNPPKPEGGS